MPKYIIKLPKKACAFFFGGGEGINNMYSIMGNVDVAITSHF